MIDVVPTGPSYRVDWDGLTERFDWVARLRGCEQDPTYHAEGDVWIHVGMVLRALVALPRFQKAPRPIQEDVFLAAALQDYLNTRAGAGAESTLKCFTITIMNNY